MLFYKGYEENIRLKMVNDPVYSQFVERSSPWRLRAIEAAVQRDQAVLNNLGNKVAAGDDPKEIVKYYAFDETGTVMISSTAKDDKDIDPDVKQVFKKALVFYAAVTAACAKVKKNLYDYDTVEKIVAGSGLFIETHREDRTFDYSRTDAAVNTAIITAVLGGVSAAGGAFAIAAKVVQSLGDEIRLSIEKKEETKKIAHLLFVCQNILGIPIVSISLFFVEAKNASFAVKVTNCASVSNQKITMKYHQDTFMFVDPEYINQFTEDFQENPQYQALIDRLAALAGEPPVRKQKAA